MTKAQVEKVQPCEWYEPWTVLPDIVRRSCSDFKFAGGNAYMEVRYMNNKLMRVLIDQPYSKINDLINQLLVKYGNVSSSSSKEEFESLQYYSEKYADIKFDGDTVVVRAISDHARNLKVQLIYTSLDYDRLKQEKINKELGDSL